MLFPGGQPLFGAAMDEVLGDPLVWGESAGELSLDEGAAVGGRRASGRRGFPRKDSYRRIGAYFWY